MVGERRQVAIGVAIVCLVGSLGASLPLPAQEADELRDSWWAQRESRWTVRGWDERLKRIDQLILDGKHDKARRKTKRLGAEMMHQIVDWGQSGHALGVTSVLRALAEAGSGREHEALWYWEMAKYFFPEVADHDLSAYGDAGELLMAERTPETPEITWEPMSTNPEGFSPPEIVKRPSIDFPEGQRLNRHESVVMVRLVIGSDGLPRWPTVLRGQSNSVWTYSVLDTLHRWRFEPARLEGRPVPVYFTLTINYALRQ